MKGDCWWGLVATLQPFFSFLRHPFESKPCPRATTILCTILPCTTTATTKWMIRWQDWTLFRFLFSTMLKIQHEYGTYVPYLQEDLLAFVREEATKLSTHFYSLLANNNGQTPSPTTNLCTIILINDWLIVPWGVVSSVVAQRSLYQPITIIPKYHTYEQHRFWLA